MNRTPLALLAAGGLALAGAGLRRAARRRRRQAEEPSGERMRVVVVGAGFGGLRVAQALKDAPVDVTLVDRNNYHLFQPLLYQVASSALEPEEIAHAVRGIFQHQPNVRFRMAEATGVSPDGRRLLTAVGEPLPFDRLVLAAGAETASYGVPGVDRYAFGLKHLEDAVALRSHIIRRFEEVTLDPAEVERGALTFVVVGGGPTGVEMAVALRELFEYVLKDDFHGLDVSQARVLLVEMGSSVLATYEPELRRYALREIESRGVEVRLETSVEEVVGEAGRATAVVVGGERIPCQTVLWAAGVRAASLADRLGLPQAGGGRVEVAGDLSVQGRPEVFVVGDMAAAEGPDGELLPQLAPVAQQQADYVAARIAAEARGEAPRPAPFRYLDKGTMATIGRGAGVAQLPGGIRLTGFVAWQAWAWLHLYLLVGFRNRANVYVNWIYNYFTYDRSARLIVDRDRLAGLVGLEVPDPGEAA